MKVAHIERLYDINGYDLEEEMEDNDLLREDLKAAATDPRPVLRSLYPDGYSGIEPAKNVGGAYAIRFLYERLLTTEKDLLEEETSLLLTLIEGKEPAEEEKDVIREAVELANYAVDDRDRDFWGYHDLEKWERERWKFGVLGVITSLWADDWWPIIEMIPVQLTLFARNASREEKKAFWDRIKNETERIRVIAKIVEKH